MTTQELLKVDLSSLRELLFSHSSIDAAALYGSVARGDIERHSDIDLLLVCRSSRKLPVFLAVKRGLDGCFDRLSVTVYSERELRFLQSAGSLFLLHLSREAVLLFDRNDFLKSVLTSFQPKESYGQDFHKSLRLMDPLSVVIQGSPNNFHRLAYIYSLFRVFGVYLLAENGVYEFSKSRMVRLLMDRFPEKRESVELLSTLRGLNSNFFTGGITAENNYHSDTSALQGTKALASLAGVELDVIPMTYGDGIRLFDKALAERSRALDYRLRMWFLLLVYDGLNLYRAKAGEEPLVSFSEPALRRLVGRESPEPICCAVEEAINYLHRYPLKYFLNDESKINPQTAQGILHGISEELMHR